MATRIGAAGSRALTGADPVRGSLLRVVLVAFVRSGPGPGRRVTAGCGHDGARVQGGVSSRCGHPYGHGGSGLAAMSSTAICRRVATIEAWRAGHAVEVVATWPWLAPNEELHGAA